MTRSICLPVAIRLSLLALLAAAGACDTASFVAAKRDQDNPGPSSTKQALSYASPGPCCDEDNDICRCTIDGDCDDDNDCTIDWCDEHHRCQHDNEQDTSPCNDLNACTENDSCLFGFCRGDPKNCDDGNFCTYLDYCDDQTGQCTHEHSPCELLGLPCDEQNDGCTCTSDAECDDYNDCTVDTCGQANVCQHEYKDDNAPCDDFDPCTENERCLLGTCHGDPKHCDDGLYCNGPETCDTNGVCQPGGDPCQLLGLVCNEAKDGCECVTDAECNDGLFCNGVEECSANQICQPGPDPCPDDGIYCNGEESCDEAAGGCVSSGNPCGVHLCDDIFEMECFDGLDNDSDGLLDCADDDCEGAEVPNGSCDTGQPGICAEGTLTCVYDGSADPECLQHNQPGPEYCLDGLDNDCDGTIDDSDCVFPNEIACFNGIDDDSDGLLDCADDDCEGAEVQNGSCDTGQPGICAEGTLTCVYDGNPDPECVQHNQPEPENCFDGLDNDCDGKIDGDEHDAELCDGLDNDCDGLIDEDFPDLGDICTIGLAGCERAGKYVCAEDGSGVACRTAYDLSSALHVLPPLGENSGELSAFDRSLTDFLAVMVCKAAPGDVCLIVKEFTSRTRNAGLDYIGLQDHHYHVNWDIDKADKGEEFEIYFAVARLNVGSVKYRARAGRTLPIKFRIDNHPLIRAHVLRVQGFAAETVAEVLISEFGLEAEETARVLHTVGYALPDLYAVLKHVFQEEVFEIERIFDCLGFTPEEYLDLTARETVEEFAPVLKFDQAMWYLPMSAERWFDRMLCGDQGGPPWYSGAYHYGACASWDVSSYDSPDMPYERWVWGNPPPVGGRDGYMRVPPAWAMVDVQDSEFPPNAPDYWWGTWGPQGGAHVPTYFKTMKTRETGALRIIYWWFYSHQPPCEWGANWDAFSDSNGEHIGDWERVMITTSPDRSVIEAITYFQHGGQYTRWRSVSGFGTEFGGHTFEAERPVVYVGKLSHGSYYDSPDITFFPYFSLACQYFDDQRECGGEHDWWFTDANLISLRSGKESWMRAESAPLPDGAGAYWQWGPAVNQCSINLGLCPVWFPPWVIPCPMFPPLGWCVKHRWVTSISTHPTQEPGIGASGQENWCFLSCRKDGCDANQWHVASQEEQDNWEAWCQGSPGPVSSADTSTNDQKIFADGACTAYERTQADGEWDNTALAQSFEALARIAAQNLGMSVDELVVAVAEGRIPTICDYAEENGQDLEDIWAEMENGCELALEQAVDEGLMTRAQADLISELLSRYDPVTMCGASRMTRACKDTATAVNGD